MKTKLLYKTTELILTNILEILVGVLNKFRKRRQVDMKNILLK